MDLHLKLPFAMIGEGEVDAEPNTFGGTQPNYNLPSIKNYADNADVAQFFRQEVYSVMEWSWINRINLEEEWRQIRRQRIQMHDTNRKYYGRSDSYLPVYVRTEKTLVSALSRGLFPSDEYMDCFERETGDPDLSKPAKAYMRYELEKVGRVRTWMKRFLQQFVAWGNSPLKVWYGMEFRRQGRNVPTKDFFGKTDVTPEFALKVMREGLRVSVRSLLYWYMYPTIADSLEDATLVFEDIDVPVGYIKEMCAKGIWKNEQDALRAPLPPNHLINQQDVLTNSFGITPPATGILGDRLVGGTRVLTEGYTFMKLPSDAYTDDEDTSDLLPVHFVCAGTRLLWCSRNEHWHQRQPYLIARQNVEPGYFYGFGEGRFIRTLQYLANDFANEANDCLIYGMSPVNKVNPSFVAGPLPPMRPGVVWKMTDIEQGHKFDRPPIDGAQAGLAAMDTFTGMAQDFGGAPPVIQGTGSGKGAKTATGASILQRNALSPLQDTVEDIELEVLIPLMEMTWINAQQFRSKPVMAAIAGQPIQITPEMLAGDFEWTWTASSQTSNHMQRAQMLIQFVQACAQMAPLLQQVGKIFDPEPILKKIWVDGLGQRGFDQIIVAMQQQPLQQAQQPGNPGAVQAEQGDRFRSALEQVFGQGSPEAEMQPGEGEDFADVRKQSEELAAKMGIH